MKKVRLTKTIRYMRGMFIERIDAHDAGYRLGSLLGKAKLIDQLHLRYFAISIRVSQPATIEGAFEPRQRYVSCKGTGTTNNAKRRAHGQTLSQEKALRQGKCFVYAAISDQHYVTRNVVRQICPGALDGS